MSEKRVITIRLSNDQREDLKRQAQNVGLSLNAYLLDILFPKPSEEGRPYTDRELDRLAETNANSETAALLTR